MSVRKPTHHRALKRVPPLRTVIHVTPERCCHLAPPWAAGQTSGRIWRLPVVCAWRRIGGDWALRSNEMASRSRAFLTVRHAVASADRRDRHQASCHGCPLRQPAGTVTFLVRVHGLWWAPSSSGMSRRLATGQHSEVGEVRIEDETRVCREANERREPVLTGTKPSRLTLVAVPALKSTAAGRSALVSREPSVRSSRIATTLRMALRTRSRAGERSGGDLRCRAPVTRRAARESREGRIGGRWS
jgi:hypothetical protein